MLDDARRGKGKKTKTERRKNRVKSSRPKSTRVSPHLRALERALHDALRDCLRLIRQVNELDAPVERHRLHQRRERPRVLSSLGGVGSLLLRGGVAAAAAAAAISAAADERHRVGLLQLPPHVVRHRERRGEHERLSIQHLRRPKGDFLARALLREVDDVGVLWRRVAALLPPPAALPRGLRRVVPGARSAALLRDLERLRRRLRRAGGALDPRRHRQRVDDVRELREVPAFDHPVRLLPQPPGGSDDDLRAAFQQSLLLLEAHPADDGDDVDAGVFRHLFQHLAHLHRELARRGDDERAQRFPSAVELHPRGAASPPALVLDVRERVVGVRVVAVAVAAAVAVAVDGFRVAALLRLLVALRQQPMQNRQPERERLPGARLRGADDVAPPFHRGVQAL
eukprot:31300-Pelagococcus_subviridis.AAC.1